MSIKLTRFKANLFEGTCIYMLLLVQSDRELVLERTGLTMSIFFFFFGPFRAAHMAYGSSQARVKLELQLLAYTTATAVPDLSRVCDLYHSSQQCPILKPLSKAGD